MERNVRLLSERECEILALLSEGYSHQDIASELKISEASVEKHLRNMLRKKQYGHTYQLVSWAYKEGVLR
jgi:two-component system response regulator DegU